MKKMLHVILGASVIIAFSTVVHADDFEMIGREISPGIDFGYRTVGALFIGKFFDAGFSIELGRFTLILDHDGAGIEECLGNTQLLRFKLIMNFNSGARLVLRGPVDGDVSASWKWNDPSCVDGGCPLISGADYIWYIDLFSPSPPDLIDCQVGEDAFIADVHDFGVRRQRFGSYGTRFTGGLVNGHLVHTPIFSPAIFGSLTLTD